MADKPAKLCELKKGKVLGGQKNFCDTFNWVVQSLNNLKGGKNCTVEWTTPDHPEINVDCEDGNDDFEGGGGGGSGGGGGNVCFTGNVPAGSETSTDWNSEFTFTTGANSNVEISCTGTTI